MQQPKKIKQTMAERWSSAKGWLVFPLALLPRLTDVGRRWSGPMMSIVWFMGLIAEANLFGVGKTHATSLTLTIPSSLSLSVSPRAGGTFAKSAPARVSVTTDNDAGYTLSIKARTDNVLRNGSYRLSSISSALTEEQYRNSGNLNTWGYLPSKLNSVTNTNFLPGPTSRSTVLDKTVVPNKSVANDYDLTLAAKVDGSIPKGSYVNTFVISASANPIKIDGVMQNWQGCKDLDEGRIMSLRDSRDGTVYRVAKLADDRCWMIDNLKIINRTITSNDSDIPSGSFTIPASNISGFKSSNYNGDWAYYSSNRDAQGYDYGAHYSWHTATAGTGIPSMSSGDASGSICPKGWRLPRGGPGGDFVALDKSMGGKGTNGHNAVARDRFIKKPIPGFTYAGTISNGSLGNQGNYTVYWSSSVFNTQAARTFELYADNRIYLSGERARYYGYSARCVMRDTVSPELLTQQWTADANDITVTAGHGIEMVMIADGGNKWRPHYAFPGKSVSLSGASGKKYIISVVPEPNHIMVGLTKKNGKIYARGDQGSYASMQNFTQCTTTGANVTDVRNGVSYAVAKIGEKCWMLSNLRLASGTVLDSSTSDVSSNFTLPTTAWADKDNEAIMIDCHGSAGNDSGTCPCKCPTGVTEYYYNWYAAKANPSSPASSGSRGDSMSLGSPCPKNWSLPNYSDDITAANVWNNGANPGMLATVGQFVYKVQIHIGESAYWWSTRSGAFSTDGSSLRFFASGVDRYADTRRSANPVRCMR